MAPHARAGLRLHLVSLLPDRVLESEEGRREYLAFPTSKSPGAGQKGRKDLLKGNGRRIDYMLHAEEGLCPDWKAVSLRLVPGAPYSTLNPSLSPCSLKMRAIIFRANPSSVGPYRTSHHRLSFPPPKLPFTEHPLWS